MTRAERVGAWMVVVAAGVYLACLLAPAAVKAQQGITVLLATGGSTNTLETQRSATLPNFAVTTTLTARNAAGVQLVTKPSSWSVSSFPAANSQGTASIAAEAGVRHVVDCVSFGADASAAVTAAAGNVAIRDGATGAGTVIWQLGIAHQVAAGAGIQTIPPHSFCGLNLAGTTNTAMTAEFNAGVTGEVQGINLSGYNVTTN